MTQSHSVPTQFVERKKPPAAKHPVAAVVTALVQPIQLFATLLALTLIPADYNPLRMAEGAGPVLDQTVHDQSRRRDIPIRVYLPLSEAPAPVALFSHGLGGSREGSAYLGKHWSGRGYVAVFLQHPGSDASVWKDSPPARRMGALRTAANPRNFLLRVQDVSAVLDQLERWNRSPGHPLAGRMDLSRIGMSGHSFGALTTQAVAGQRWGGARWSFTDPRIRAAILFSPSAPRRGPDPKTAFGAVRIPWMLMTGTQDVAAIGDADLNSRLAVYPALPDGEVPKYELVLDGAEHSAFTDRPLPGDSLPRNPNHHRAILALSTAFWDAHLRGDPAAKAWLEGDGPSTVLDPKDRWRHRP